MKKKVLALSAFVALYAGVSFGQQDKLLTHFVYDKMSVNPAATGIDNGICATLIYRNQWDRVNGAPNSAVFNTEANLGDFIPLPWSSGVGISFFHDAIGFNRQNNLNLNYSAQFQVSNAGVLAVGAGLGILNFGVNPVWVPPQTLVDNVLLNTPTNGETKFDMNAGVYFKGRQGYYVGLSTTHLTQAELANFNYNTRRHYYLMGGYKKQVGSNGEIDGNLFMRTDLAKFSVDVSARYIHNNKFYGGLTYRTSDAIAAMLGMRFDIMQGNRFSPNLWVGYSYDMTINKLSTISRGTHEMMVRGCISIPPPPPQISKHPRWL